MCDDEDEMRDFISRRLIAGQVGDYENYFDQILNQDFDEWIASRFGGKGFTFKYKIHREQSDQS